MKKENISADPGGEPVRGDPPAGTAPCEPREEGLTDCEIPL